MGRRVAIGMLYTACDGREGRIGRDFVLEL